MSARNLFFGLALATSQGVLAQALPEFDLKATYAYNFAVLTQWPPATRASFNFCVYGDDGVAEAMRRLQGKSVHGRSVAVARLGALTAIRDCDLLYVGRDEAPSLPHIAALLGDAPSPSPWPSVLRPPPHAAARSPSAPGCAPATPSPRRGPRRPQPAYGRRPDLRQAGARALCHRHAAPRR